jgi:hypothetical protein
MALMQYTDQPLYHTSCEDLHRGENQEGLQYLPLGLYWSETGSLPQPQGVAGEESSGHFCPGFGVSRMMQPADGENRVVPERLGVHCA